MVIPMQLQEYLQELNKIELLGRAEELALWQAYKDSGDARARKKLIEAYVSFEEKAEIYRSLLKEKMPEYIKAAKASVNELFKI